MHALAGRTEEALAILAEFAALREDPRFEDHLRRLDLLERPPRSAVARSGR